MGFRRRAGGGKRDAAEAEIVSVLRQRGYGVWILGGTGNPDLLVLARGTQQRWHPMEVKTGKGTLTINQMSLQWPVVRSVEEALSAIGAK